MRESPHRSACRHQRAHDQERFGKTSGIGLVKLCIYRGIHDGRLAIIVSADSVGNISGVCKKTMNTAGGGGIPARETRHEPPKQPGAHAAYLSRSEIGIELIPAVSHGRVAVANMQRSAWYHHRFRRTVARADHQIEAIEVELLDRSWKRQQIRAVMAGGPWQPLYERARRRKSIKSWRHGPLGFQQREQRGRGK
jgi:hypothetical protein